MAVQTETKNSTIPLPIVSKSVKLVCELCGQNLRGEWKHITLHEQVDGVWKYIKKIACLKCHQKVIQIKNQNRDNYLALERANQHREYFR